MRKIDRIQNEYFDWMYDMMCKNKCSDDISYRKLFSKLHTIEFTYSIERDGNRYEDGLALRGRFGYRNNVPDVDLYLTGPCSVLEMMVALAVRIEEDIMDDTRYGDRTAEWFWGMIVSLGLGGMRDSLFDRKYVENCIDTLLRRRYLPDGRGGLFTVRGCEYDLRRVEIWYQMQWYLNTFT